MNIQFLDNLRREYKKTDATIHLKLSGWNDIAAKIGASEPFYKKIFFSPIARVSLGLFVVLILFFGAYQTAKASLPGDVLYPIKLLSERIAKDVTGNNQIVIEHRAEEVVSLAQQKEIKSEALEHAAIQYAQVVEETKKEIRSSGHQDPEFEQQLKAQHQQFDEVVKENPSVENDIKKAQESSDRESN